MFSTLLMGGGGHTREKDHQNVKSLIIFAHDCRGGGGGANGGDHVKFILSYGGVLAFFVVLRGGVEKTLKIL